MSTLLAGAVIAQLCYVPENDIGSAEVMRQADVLLKPLTALVEAGSAGCIDINHSRALDEARSLILVDSTDATFVLNEGE